MVVVTSEVIGGNAVKDVGEEASATATQVKETINNVRRKLILGLEKPLTRCSNQMFCLTAFPRQLLLERRHWLLRPL